VQSGYGLTVYLGAGGVPLSNLAAVPCLIAGQWHSILLLLDASTSSVALYVNGKLVGLQTSVTWSLPPLDYWMLGTDTNVPASNMAVMNVAWGHGTSVPSFGTASTGHTFAPYAEAWHVSGQRPPGETEFFPLTDFAPGGLSGNICSTTIAAGSDGNTLPQSTIHVVSTTGCPTSGSYLVTTISALVSCTGKTSNTLTGCTNGSGTLHTGQTVQGPAGVASGMGGTASSNFCAFVGGSCGMAWSTSLASPWDPERP
jgi:hypothetical protein